MPIENCDYFVHIVDFPTCACGGCVMLNEDGTYTVLLNAHLSSDQNRRSIDHELRHILHDDFFRDVPFQQKESEAG